MWSHDFLEPNTTPMCLPAPTSPLIPMIYITSLRMVATCRSPWPTLEPHKKYNSFPLLIFLKNNSNIRLDVVVEREWWCFREGNKRVIGSLGLREGDLVLLGIWGSIWSEPPDPPFVSCHFHTLHPYLLLLLFYYCIIYYYFHPPFY